MVYVIGTSVKLCICEFFLFCVRLEAVVGEDVSFKVVIFHIVVLTRYYKAYYNCWHYSYLSYTRLQCKLIKSHFRTPEDGMIQM